MAAKAAFCEGTGIGSVLCVITGREPGLEPMRRAVRGEIPIFLFLVFSEARLFGTMTKSDSWSVFSGLDPLDLLAWSMSVCSLVSILELRGLMAGEGGREEGRGGEEATE